MDTREAMHLEPGSIEVLPFAEENPVQVQGRNWYAWGGRMNQSSISACADEPIGQVRLIDYAKGEKPHILS